MTGKARINFPGFQGFPGAVGTLISSEMHLKCTHLSINCTCITTKTLKQVKLITFCNYNVAYVCKQAYHLTSNDVQS